MRPRSPGARESPRKPRLSSRAILPVHYLYESYEGSREKAGFALCRLPRSMVEKAMNKQYITCPKGHMILCPECDQERLQRILERLGDIRPGVEQAETEKQA